MNLDVAPIIGSLVRLEPFATELKEEVRAAIDCDAEAWALMPGNPMGEGFDGFLGMACAAPADQRIVYAIRDVASGIIVGMSTYYTSQLRHDGVEIGTTFLHPKVRSGYVNFATKLLMLDHAFQAGAVRVQFRVDERNLRSQAAVTKLGAVREGMFRRDQRTWTGHFRNTIFFSILSGEWPAAKKALEDRLASLADTGPATK